MKKLPQLNEDDPEYTGPSMNVKGVDETAFRELRQEVDFLSQAVKKGGVGGSESGLEELR